MVSLEKKGKKKKEKEKFFMRVNLKKNESGNLNK